MTATDEDLNSLGHCEANMQMQDCDACDESRAWMVEEIRRLREGLRNVLLMLDIQLVGNAEEAARAALEERPRS